MENTQLENIKSQIDKEKSKAKKFLNWKLIRRKR